MRRSVLNFVLAIGFFAVAAGVLVARGAPASGYESSIYLGTPQAMWVTIGFALAIAVGTVLSCRGPQQAAGIVLGGTAMTAVVAIPAIRNYRFSGMGDSLTHLGWVRDFVNGAMYPHELFYPGLHSIASVFHLVGGIPLERSVLLTVVFLFIPFVIFVPLVVRDMTGSAAAVGFAAIASWMILPINNVATHMGAHTNSNALFLVPVVIFAFIAYTRRRTDLETLPLGISPLGALIFLTGAGLLLVHPQQMVNVVVMLVAISAVQFLARRRYEDHPISRHAPAYAHAFSLGGLFVVWAASNERFRDAFAGLIYGVFAADIGASSEVDQRGGSLTEIGGSIGELFVKMFLVSALVSLVVGLFILLTWLGRTRLDLETKSFVTYFVGALVPLTGMFLVYFIGTPTMAFRQVGFIFVLLTILSGIALAHGVGWLSGLITSPGANAVASLFLGVCLVLALLTVFSTPYIYTPTQHVTDQQFSGYESSFEHGDETTPYAGFGFGVERYGHGIHGVEQKPNVTYTAGGEEVVDPEAFNDGNYTGAYPTDRYYFVVTEYDTTRELDVYRGLHHDEAALEGIETDSNANKFLSNDQYELYAVHNASV